jgi:hypothetical protein
MSPNFIKCNFKNVKTFLMSTESKEESVTFFKGFLVFFF